MTALVQRLTLENYRVSERMFIPHWGESQMRRHFNTMKYLVGPVRKYFYKHSGERSLWRPYSYNETQHLKCCEFYTPKPVSSVVGVLPIPLVSFGPPPLPNTAILHCSCKTCSKKTTIPLSQVCLLFPH